MTSTPTDIPPEAAREAEYDFADFDPDDAIDADDPAPGERSRGGSLLTDLADVLRGARLDVQEVDGWRQRQRGGAGYRTARPLGIIVHHTASSSKWDGDGDVRRMTYQHEIAPLANLYLDRTGRWWVMAAGATNTNGKGGPWGPLPTDGANSRVIGIEAGNNGVGEPWPDAMQDSYVRGVAALADGYRIDTNNVLAHFEWAPKRKIDPAGPSRFGSVNTAHSWNMDAFRSEVNSRRGKTSKLEQRTPPAASNDIYVVAERDTWWRIADTTMGDPATNWLLLAQANGGKSRVLHPGDVLNIPQPAAVPAFPGEARLGDRGPVVLAWQNALIEQRVIRDNQANRDAYYGEGMQRAVVALQRSWEWSDADGVAGMPTWKRLHGS